MKKFPEGFSWGAATAAYQVEGGIENTDWSKAARDGRVAAAGRLGDHFNRYEEDFDIAKELGHNAHRFSVEWVRIEPEVGKFDHEAIEHYRKVLRALRDRGIRPYITLWHFVLPLWFAKSGGFERKDASEIFARYCEFVVKELGDLCEDFVTINEPEIYASLGWIRGAWPPFKRFSLIDFSQDVSEEHRESESTARPSMWHFFTFLKVVNNLAESHNLAYHRIKKSSPNAKVSLVKHVHVFDSNKNPYNILKKKIAHSLLNERMMKKIRGHYDYLSLNYYRYTKFGDTKSYLKSDMGWNLNPRKIYDALMYFKKFGKPIVVSEAGIADRDDSDRAMYIKNQLEAVWQAIEDGADVRGFMYWSLLDNYEWDLGTTQRFGLVEVNYETLERKIRPSAYEYKKICVANGLE